MNNQNEITEYDIVVFNGTGGAPLVQQYIEDGWQPWGSPLKTGNNIYQAMVKYASTPYGIVTTAKTEAKNKTRAKNRANARAEADAAKAEARAAPSPYKKKPDPSTFLKGAE